MPAMIRAIYIVGGGFAISAAISPSRPRVQTRHERVGVELGQRKIEEEVESGWLLKSVSSSMVSKYEH